MIQKTTLRAAIRYNKNVPQWEVWCRHVLDMLELSPTSRVGFWSDFREVRRGCEVFNVAGNLAGVEFGTEDGVWLTIETFVTVHTPPA